jgi:predicted NAD/FAD-binding protein
VEFHDRLNVVDDRERLTIESSWLPAPLHLLPSIAKTRYLSGSEKLALSRALVAMLAKGPGKSETAGDYLRSLGCSDDLLARLVEPVIVSALNESAGDASAKYARMVLVESLVKGKHSYRLGVPRLPQSELIGNAATRWLAGRGCDIRLNARVRNLHEEDGLVRFVELASGERMEFDAYVAAVPPDALARMGIGTEGGERLAWRPIVSAHLFYENPVPSFEPACAVGEPFGWVFAKQAIVGYVQAVASAAESVVGLSNSEALDLARRAASQVEPALRDLPVKRGIVYRERRATFATLSCDAHRPSAIASSGNLFLAGDWTGTGWPATIESAVRSGNTAAKALLKAN